jgi:hypothetical protein
LLKKPTYLYNYHLPVQLSPTCTITTYLYNYHLPIQLPPTYTITTYLYNYHLPVQLPPTCTITTYLYNYHLPVQLVYITNKISSQLPLLTSCTIIPPSKAIVNAASNITYRPLIEADDTGRCTLIIWPIFGTRLISFT